MSTRLISADTILPLEERLKIKTQIDKNVLSHISDFQELIPGIIASTTRLSIESIEIKNRFIKLQKDVLTKSDLRTTRESIIDLAAEVTRLTNFYYENREIVDTLKVSFIALDEKVNILIAMGARQIANQELLDVKLNNLLSNINSSNSNSNSGPLAELKVVKINSSYNALSNEVILADTTQNKITVMLPNTPTVGDVISIVDSMHTFDINPVTVNPGLILVNGNVGNVIIDTINPGPFIYSGPKYGWVNAPIVYPENPKFVEISSSYTATKDNIILVDDSIQSNTITLPANPTVDTIITIVDIKQAFNRNPLIINANGKMIDGLTNTPPININTPITFKYSGDIYGWVTIPSLTNTSTPSQNIVHVNSDYTAKVNDYILANSLDESFTIKLPINAKISDTITIVDENNIFAAHPVIIDPSDSSINRIAGLQRITIPDQVVFTYQGDSAGWTTDPLILSESLYSYGTPNLVITSINYNANNKDYIIADTKDNSMTIKLPAKPNISDMVTIIDGKNTFDINTAVLDPNGSKLFGSLNIINLDSDLATFVYSGPKFGWVATNNYTGGNWETISNDLVMLESTNVFVDSSSGPIQITLPSSPKNYEYITVVDIAGTFEQYPCRINGNGRKVINDIIVDVDVKHISMTIMYNIDQWILVEKIGNPKDISSQYTAEANDQLMVDTSKSEIIITLPNSPINNFTITISDAKGTFDIHNCIIEASHVINNDKNSMILDLKFSSITLIFVNDHWIMNA